MPIDRIRALRALDSYVCGYDPSDPKIALKVAHTHRVASLCEEIACSEGWRAHDVDLAWLCGLLHDIGRFEQVHRYGTFADAKSESHASIGVEVLFGEGRIRDYLDDSSEDDLVRAAIAHHSSFRLPDDLDVRTRAFCDLLRDADKIDILRAFCESDAETVLNLEPGSIAASPLGRGVTEAFWAHRTCRRDERTYPADYIASYACFVFELVFSHSRAIARRQGYVFALLSRPFANPATAAEFARMKAHVEEWL